MEGLPRSMRMFIPNIGEEITLYQDWTFDLLNAHCNKAFANKFGNNTSR